MSVRRAHVPADACTELTPTHARSFIKGFTRKPYRVSDQTKLIFDFLAFISGIMRQTAPFSTLSEPEFENALEAMEKLIMNRLYTSTFSPAIAKEGRWKVQTDDLERDRVFRQRTKLFEWIGEEHLDVPAGEHSKGFVDFAMQGEWASRGARARSVLTLGLRRASQDQPLQGAARQAHLHPQLLQSDLWAHPTRFESGECRYVHSMLDLRRAALEPGQPHLQRRVSAVRCVGAAAQR